MKYLLSALLAVQFVLFCKNVVAQPAMNMNNSPYNMNNSSYNMENSPYNMRNSPYNMDNSPYNMSATNGVYDNSGNRIGYEVKAPSGVTNYFDNSGNRIGYTPAKRWAMLSGVIFLSLILPVQISTQNPKFEPLIVKATIDTAVLIGLPSSKAARKYAQQKQAPEYLVAQANQALSPVGWRRLYFRTHFYWLTKWASIKFNK